MKNSKVYGSIVMVLFVVIGIIGINAPGYLSDRRVSDMVSQVNRAHAGLPTGGALCDGFPGKDIEIGSAQAAGVDVWERCDATIVRARVENKIDCQKLAEVYEQRGVHRVVVEGTEVMARGNPGTNFTGRLIMPVLKAACSVSENPVVYIGFLPSKDSMRRYFRAHAQEIAQWHGMDREQEAQITESYLTK